jgi:transglutaminase-like putative cysteine protease
MPTFQIQHITRYEYDRPVRESANQIKIYPYPQAKLHILSHALHISGDPQVFQYQDYWGNTTGMFSIDAAHEDLEIESRLIVSTQPAAAPAAAQPGEWAQIQQAVGRQMSLWELSRPEAVEAAISAWAKALLPSSDAPAAFVQRCSEHIFGHFEYQKGITTIETTLADLLEHRAGVCQDFAHLLLEMLRSAAIPARYVSGYICPNRDGVRGAGATHAWVEAWLPSSGWTGIDPTNNAWVGDQHVPLAVGRDFSDCTPMKGAFKGPADQQLSVYVSVGYEDGGSFEDRNIVQMQTEPAGPWVGAAQQQ